MRLAIKLYPSEHQPEDRTDCAKLASSLKEKMENLKMDVILVLNRFVYNKQQKVKLKFEMSKEEIESVLINEIIEMKKDNYKSYH